MRILVASNDVRVHKALELLSEQEPAEVVIAESSALEDLAVQLPEFKPDLLLLDWELPGRVATALLFAHFAGAADLKVVVLGDRAEYEQAALAAGADCFVCKDEPPARMLVACWRALAEGLDG